MTDQETTETRNNLSERLEQAREELENVTEKARKAARGALNRIENNSSSFFDELVKAGEKYQKEREKERKKAAKSSRAKESEGLRDRVAGYLGLTTREDLEQLNKKLNTLSRKVRKIEKEATRSS